MLFHFNDGYANGFQCYRICTLHVLFLSLLRPAELVDVEHRHRNASSQTSPYCGRQICDVCPVSGYLVSSVTELNQKQYGGKRPGVISTSWRLAFEVDRLYLLYSKREIIVVYSKPVRSLKCDELRSAGECDSFIFKL